MKRAAVPTIVGALLAVAYLEAGVATIYRSGMLADFRPAVIAVAPETGQERILTVGGNLQPNMQIAAGPDGSVYAGDEDTVVRINPESGVQTVAAQDIGLLTDGQSVAVLPGGDVVLFGSHNFFEARVVQISNLTGQAKLVASGGSLRPNMKAAAAKDGSLLVGDETTVVRLDPTAGTQAVLAQNLVLLTNFRSLAALSETEIAVFGSFNPFEPRVVRVSTVTGQEQLLAAGGLLRADMLMASGRDGTLYASDDSSLVRIDAQTGAQTLVAGQLSLLASFVSVCVAVTGDPGVVSVPPMFTQIPEDRLLAPGSTATFAATASGVPAPTWQWYFGTNLLAGKTSSTLTLTNISHVDEGLYLVVAKNAAGGITSPPVRLSLMSVPIINQPPASCVVSTGAAVTLSIGATPESGLRFQWRLNGQAIPHATGEEYIIPAAQVATVGRYTVLVTNPAGTAESAPANVTLFDLLPFDAGGYARAVVTGPMGASYRIEYREALAPENAWQPATTLTLAASPTVWIDEDSPAGTRRFYRAVLLNP